MTIQIEASPNIRDSYVITLTCDLCHSQRLQTQVTWHDPLDTDMAEHITQIIVREGWWAAPDLENGVCCQICRQQAQQHIMGIDFASGPERSAWVHLTCNYDGSSRPTRGLRGRNGLRACGTQAGDGGARTF